MIKKTLCAIAFVSTVSFADFSQMNAPIGSMSVFDHANKQQGGYLWNNQWGLSDLQAITSDNLTFELAPNINTYGDGTDPYWAGGDGDGNKWMEANTVWEKTIGAADTGASFSAIALYADCFRHAEIRESGGMITAEHLERQV